MTRLYKIFAFCLLAMPTQIFAAAPYSEQPPSEVSVPYQFGGYSSAGIAMPPQVPPYLPNGATNLDYIWTQDGGARLYWNSVLIPQQLKMGGATWQDPALVPELFPPQQRRVIRRPVVRSQAATPAAKAAVKSTASKAAPVPAVKRASSSSPIPPLRARPAAEPVPVPPIIDDAGPMPDPPRLQ